MRINFIGGANAGRSPLSNVQDSINFYLELDNKDTLAKAPLSNSPGTPPSFTEDTHQRMFLTNTPGSHYISAPSTGICRGLITQGNILYGIFGPNIYSIQSLETEQWIPIGTLTGDADASARVPSAVNGQGQDGQIILIDRGATSAQRGYIIQSGNQFSQITATGFPDNVSQVCFLDGYFIVVTDVTDQKFYWSSLYDGTKWDATDVASAEVLPDPVKSIASFKRNLWLFGDNSTEVRYLTSDPDNPFALFQGGLIPIGIAAIDSVSIANNSLFWLSRDKHGQGMVVTVETGLTPHVVSTPAVNYQISQYDTIWDAFAYTYQMEGHEFYVLTFPTANATWVYDVLTKQWHKWSSFGLDNRHISNAFAMYDDELLVGDYRFPGRGLLKLQSDWPYDDTASISRQRISQHLNIGNERSTINEFELLMEGLLGEDTVPSVSGTTEIQVSVFDNIGMAGVQYQLDGNDLGSEVTTFPFSFSWDTTTVANAQYTLTAIARDKAGNTTSTPGSEVIVNN